MAAARSRGGMSAVKNKRRSRLDRILQRLSVIVLLWAVATPFMADGRTEPTEPTEDVGKAIKDAACSEYLRLTIDENPECFSVAENTSTGFLIMLYKGSAAESAKQGGWARCPSFVVLPGGSTWHRAVQGGLFLFALAFSFLGIAIISDMFMAAIETITAQTKLLPNGEEEDVWNPTVANLTLMALGSSAPEILLNVVGVATALDEAADPLGPSTIVGSASFNLLIISAVCVLAPLPDVRKIEEVGVFMITAVFSIWAYIWLLIILQVSTPGEIEIWEAAVTLLQFPILVFVAYGQDVKWKFGKGNEVEPANDAEGEPIVSDAKAQKHNYIEYRRHGAKAIAGARRETLERLDVDPSQLQDVPEFDHRGRSSDPYCKVIIGEGENAIEKETKWLSKKLNPKWNEKFILEIPPELACKKGVTIKFECWDHDELTTDDYLGCAELELDAVEKSNGETHVLELSMKKDPSKDCGFIKVAVQIITDCDENSQDCKAVVVSVFSATGLLAMDNPNKVLDMMASQLGRHLRRLETSKRWRIVKRAYYNQFVEAVQPGGEGDELTTMDCVMHFLTIFWKVLFATVPPPHLAGGWLAFVICLVYIGGLTAVVGELASLFGCVAGVSKSLTAITFVALGTSLPDTFASKVAAVQEDTADASLGNVTGSNSVNVFLGIGLPWTLAAVYWKTKCNLNFPAGGPGFVEGVIVFSCCALICLAMLAVRRKVVGAELGGDNKMLAYGSSTLFVVLWFTYIGMAAYFEQNPMFAAPDVAVTSIANGCSGPVQ